MSAPPPAGVPASCWRDWTWQMRQRIRDAETLVRWVRRILADLEWSMKKRELSVSALVRNGV